MKQFAVFQHPALGYETVKVGWSWPAFFFSWLWALVKRLWLIGVIVLLLAALIPYTWMGGAAIIIAIVMGATGNDLREKRLRNRGYEMVATVQAKTPDGALAVHLASQGNQDTVPPEGIVR